MKVNHAAPIAVMPLTPSKRWIVRITPAEGDRLRTPRPRPATPRMAPRVSSRPVLNLSAAETT